MLVILGSGSTKVKYLRNKKEKHIWSVQIMNELLERSSSIYEYEDYQSLSAEGEMFKPDKPDEEEPKDRYNREVIDPVSYTKPKCQLVLTALGDWLFKAGSNGPWVQLASENIEEKTSNLGMLGGNRKSLGMRETAILIAARNGIIEMVERILEVFPVAIDDRNSDNKNIVLLAVENKQSRVYELLLSINIFKDVIFRQVDTKGNSALHLAATLGGYKPWLIPGPALQMQWEIKWYEFVKDSIDPNFINQPNKEGKTPEEVFTETHKELAKEGSQWLTESSNSCFLVATIITTVTFASSATVPGGVNGESGVPTLEEQPAFFVFAISSLIALCFSVISVITYLSILTTRHLEKDFASLLPRKYLLALTSLLISIVFMLVSFCSSHFFVLRDKLKLNAYPLYALSCLVVTLFVVFQFPLYLDFMTASFSKVPQRSLKDKASSL